MITTAVVGTGNWGKNLVRVFYSLRNSRLICLCDTDPGNLAAVGRSCPGVRLTGDYREVLEDRGLQAVAIATPAASHYSLARESLLAGKHTFVEKPLCLSASEARDLVNLAESESLVLMAGHLLIYHPATAMLKRMIDQGELGEIYYIYSQRVNLGMVRRDENALWSLGPHDISIILHLIGESPVEVSARGASYLQPGTEDVVFLIMRFPSGSMAHVQLSWLDPHKERKITVVGSRKMAVFDDMQASEKIKVFDKGINISRDYNSYAELLTLREGDILIPQLKMEEPLAAECRHFIECVEQKAICRTGGNNGLEVVRVCEAATESIARGGAPVNLEEIK